MRFVHIADMHFDAPFVTLGNKGNLGDIRRLEQRNVFKKIIEYIKDNNVPYLFISGDLYENEYVRASTIDYINNMFKEISATKIYIAPGNHDPFIKNSYYNKFDWNDNVYIFTKDLGQYENEDCNIYGFGFDNFYLDKFNLSDIRLSKDTPNILLMHADLDGGLVEGREYNPVSSMELKQLGFDYIALGHIHKPYYEENICYPGSTISMGFDELGEHGMIVGEINNSEVKVKFVPLDSREFKEIDINISDIYSEEELVEKINQEVGNNPNINYKVILIGNKNIGINKESILKLVDSSVLKIKDKTKLKYNLEELRKENSLKGIFVNEMLIKLEENPANKEEIEKAIEIGLLGLE